MFTVPISSRKYCPDDRSTSVFRKPLFLSHRKRSLPFPPPSNSSSLPFKFDRYGRAESAFSWRRRNPAELFRRSVPNPRGRKSLSHSADSSRKYLKLRLRPPRNGSAISSGAVVLHSVFYFIFLCSYPVYLMQGFLCPSTKSLCHTIHYLLSKTICHGSQRVGMGILHFNEEAVVPENRQLLCNLICPRPNES